MIVLIDGTPFFRKTDGVGRYSTNLIDRVVEQRPEWHFILVCFWDDRYQKNTPSLTKNLKKIYLPFPRKLYQFVFRKGVKIPVDMFLPSFDVYLGLNFVQFPYVKGGKKVIFIHDLAYHDIPEVVEKKNLRYLRKNIPASIEEATLVIATSKFTKKRLLSVFDNIKKCVAVENAVSSSFVSSGSKRDGSIIALGTLEPRKNLSTLLRAYDMLDGSFQKKHPLYIIGKPGWGQLEETFIKPSSRQFIFFTGHVNDSELINYFNRSGLFIFPSLYEGFGLPLLEAMLSKIPIAASNIEPFRDIAGDTILYFDPAKDHDIARVIKEHFIYHNKSPIEKAYQIAKRYTWDRSAKTLCAEIEKL